MALLPIKLDFFRSVAIFDFLDLQKYVFNSHNVNIMCQYATMKRNEELISFY